MPLRLSGGRERGQQETEVAAQASTADEVDARRQVVLGEDELDEGVEGLEKEVLEGVDLTSYRPWVLVVESTRPNSTEDTSHEWESIVLDSGYEMTLFDGLNKFYVRTDLTSIREALSTPANVFDQWVSWELVETRRVLNQSTDESRAFMESLVERAEASEAYAARLELLLNKANGWLPERVRS